MCVVKHISLAYRLYRTRRNICSVEQCKYIRKNIRIYVCYENEMTNILYHAKKYWNKSLHILYIYIYISVCVCVCIMFYVYPTFYIMYSMKYFIGFICFRYMLHLRNIGIKGSIYIYIYIYVCVCVCIMFYVYPTFYIMYSMKYFILVYIFSIHVTSK